MVSFLHCLGFLALLAIVLLLPVAIRTSSDNVDALSQPIGRTLPFFAESRANISKVSFSREIDYHNVTVSPALPSTQTVATVLRQGRASPFSAPRTSPRRLAPGHDKRHIPPDFFWDYEPRDCLHTHLGGTMDNNTEATQWLYLFAKESGFRKLRRVFEQTFLPTLFDRQGLVKPGFSCKLLSDFNYTDVDPTQLCLPSEALLLPTRRSTFQEFLRPGDVRYESLYRDVTSWGSLCGAEQFPFFSGACVRFASDYVYETVTHFFYLRHSRRWHPVVRSFDISTIANRSLLYWNINPNLPDIRVLRRALEDGSLSAHVFLISHNQDKLSFPEWLLEHPKVLKVFAVHVPRNVSHAKLVALPEGVHPVKTCRLLCYARNVAGHTPQKFSLFAKFQLSSEERVVLHQWLSNQTDLLDDPNMLKRVNKTNYYANMVQHKFILSPCGNGLDTFRLWESLYMGRVPVTTPSLHPSLLQDLPVLLVDDWTQLQKATLESQWKALNSRLFNLNKLWAPWWLLCIMRVMLETV